MLAAAIALAATACAQPVYLTLDTGHMGVAEQVAEVLTRHQVKASFFLANEPTQDGAYTLDERWAPYWRARVAEGHLFGSHTWSHDIWVADVAGGFRVRTQAGKEPPRWRTLTPAQYCESLKQPAARFQAMTGQTMAPIFRAPGGHRSSKLLAAARTCGFAHVGWTPAGFLGDELDSARHPNGALLQRALRTVKAGDILLMHLGIWNRQDPWAPAVLEPLIAGLKAKGLCFASLRDHPRFGQDLP